ncbi:unnamed protein product [Penicillium pancosmium]
MALEDLEAQDLEDPKEVSVVPTAALVALEAQGLEDPKAAPVDITAALTAVPTAAPVAQNLEILKEVLVALDLEAPAAITAVPVALVALVDITEVLAVLVVAGKGTQLERIHAYKNWDGMGGYSMDSGFSR